MTDVSEVDTLPLIPVYPGGGNPTPSKDRATTHANWGVSCKCSCGDRGYTLDECSVKVDLNVLLSKNSGCSLAWLRAKEMQHVEDFQIAIVDLQNKARTLEDNINEGFDSKDECEASAEGAMLGLLSEDIGDVVAASHKRYDAPSSPGGNVNTFDAVGAHGKPCPKQQ